MVVLVPGVKVTVPTMEPGAGPLTSMMLTWGLVPAMGKPAGKTALSSQAPTASVGTQKPTHCGAFLDTQTPEGEAATVLQARASRGVAEATSTGAARTVAAVARMEMMVVVNCILAVGGVLFMKEEVEEGL